MRLEPDPYVTSDDVDVKLRRCGSNIDSSGEFEKRRKGKAHFLRPATDFAEGFEVFGYVFLRCGIRLVGSQIRMTTAVLNILFDSARSMLVRKNSGSFAMPELGFRDDVKFR